MLHRCSYLRYVDTVISFSEVGLFLSLVFFFPPWKFEVYGLTQWFRAVRVRNRDRVNERGHVVEDTGGERLLYAFISN